MAALSPAFPNGPAPSSSSTSHANYETASTTTPSTDPEVCTTLPTCSETTFSGPEKRTASTSPTFCVQGEYLQYNVTARETLQGDVLAQVETVVALYFESPTALSQTDFEHTLTSYRDICSKQVYQEAYEILSRHNTVILGGGNTKRERYNKSLTGLLRLFPCTPARNVTRVRLGYNDQLMRISSQWGGAPSHGPRGDNTERFAKRQFPSETFIDILRDAHVLSQFFDKLRVFEACWSLQERRFLQEGTEGIERWMGKCTQKGYVVPWDGVRFKLWVWEKLGLEEQERCLNEAYRMLVKGHTNDKIEDSGRVWLEEMPEGKGREKKKGHRNGKRCT
jgi:hypothetical protein